MNLLSNGIYFEQVDIRDVGYYTEDDQGNLIHHDYKKPSYWQRAKYFAKYGYEMNLDTRVTNYVYFFYNVNELSYGSIVGDAVSTARNLFKNGNYDTTYEYKISENTVTFESLNNLYELIFFDKNLKFKMYVTMKKNNKTTKSTYRYLDWNGLY